MRLPRRSLLAALFLAHPGCARAACTRVVDLPLHLVEGYPLVPASLAGAPVSLLLDTGAEGMSVEPSVAEALHLPLRGLTRIYGTGGSRDARLVLLPGLRLGDAAMPAQVAPVVPLPIALPATPPLAGLLGASLLSQFDLDLDAPGGRVSLFLPGDCPTPPGTVLPLTLSRAGEAFIPVRVNGQRLVAEIDTGSRATLLTTNAARRLGLDMPVSANTAPGIDGQRLPVGHVRVRFALGDGVEADTPASIAPLQLDDADMLLGFDVLGRQRVWIGYSRREVSFAPRAP